MVWVPLKADTEMRTWEQVVHLGADPRKQKWASREDERRREADVSVCCQRRTVSKAMDFSREACKNCLLKNERQETFSSSCRAPSVESGVSKG